MLRHLRYISTRNRINRHLFTHPISAVVPVRSFAIMTGQADIQQALQQPNTYTTPVSQLIGIKYTTITKQRVEATLTVRHALLQPFSLLHGGINALVGEELATIATHVNNTSNGTVTTLNAQAHHLSSAREGDVLSLVCTPIKVGRGLQIWSTTVTHNDNGKTRHVARSKCITHISQVKKSTTNAATATTSAATTPPPLSSDVYIAPELTEFGEKLRAGVTSPVFQLIGFTWTHADRSLMRGHLTVRPDMVHSATGVLHTGISACIAEELGSVAANQNRAPGTTANSVGTWIGLTHVADAYVGDTIIGTATPIKTGARTQLWQIDIHAKSGEQPQRLVEWSQLATFNPGPPKSDKPKPAAKTSSKSGSPPKSTSQQSQYVDNYSYFAPSCHIAPEHQEYYNAFKAGTVLSQLCNFQITKLSAHQLEGTVLVNKELLQPFGLTHGGLNAMIGEELCGMGAVLNNKYGTPNGFNIDAHHMSSAYPGETLYISATPVRMDDEIQVWTSVITAGNVAGGPRRKVAISTLIGIAKRDAELKDILSPYVASPEEIARYRDLKQHQAMAADAFVQPELKDVADGMRAGHVSAFMKLLNLQFTHYSTDKLCCQLLVDRRHAQIFKVMHGGMNAVIAEELGSVLATLNHPSGPGTPGIVGTWVEASHLAAAKLGDTVVAECTAIKKGRRTQLWSIDIYVQQQDGKLKQIATSQLSTFNGGKVGDYTPIKGGKSKL